MMDNSPALDQGNIDRDPIKQFKIWYDAAVGAAIPETDAVTLATANRDGRPSARIVLLKSFDDSGFVFYTNYNSRKAKELDENPRASLVAYWAPIKRQVRIDGTVEKVSAAESDEYFQSRPLGSRVGAWASNQSEAVKNREVLEQRYAEFSERFGEDVPRPPHWGGFRIRPETIEFWQGRDNRLHDRLRYRRQEDGSWLLERLSP
jgi:pyridoxamine 5'-phosphate oxidase